MGSCTETIFIIRVTIKNITAPEQQTNNVLYCSNVKFAAVDASEEHNIAVKYGIHGLPTVKLFSKQSPDPIEYDGDRNAEKLSE